MLLGDFDDTAAILKSLDLVVSPDMVYAAPRGRPRSSNLGRPALGGRMALAPDRRNEPVVSHGPVVPATHGRRLGRGLPADRGRFVGS